MDRVGRKRLVETERQITIIHAIARLRYQYGKPATLHSVAGMLSMTPSSHLRQMLNTLIESGMITRSYVVNGRNQSVANYDVIKTESQHCDLPWKCDGLCVIHSSGRVCVGKDFNRSEGV